MSYKILPMKGTSRLGSARCSGLRFPSSRPSASRTPVAATPRHCPPILVLRVPWVASRRCTPRWCPPRQSTNQCRQHRVQHHSFLHGLRASSYVVVPALVLPAGRRFSCLAQQRPSSVHRSGTGILLRQQPLSADPSGSPSCRSFRRFLMPLRKGIISNSTNPPGSSSGLGTIRYNSRRNTWAISMSMRCGT